MLLRVLRSLAALHLPPLFGIVSIVCFMLALSNTFLPVFKVGTECKILPWESLSFTQRRRMGKLFTVVVF